MAGSAGFAIPAQAADVMCGEAFAVGGLATLTIENTGGHRRNSEQRDEPIVRWCLRRYERREVDSDGCWSNPSR